MSDKTLDKNLIEALYLRDKYTVEEIADYLDTPYYRLYNFMNKYNIHRRNRSEAGFNFYKMKPQFLLKPSLTNSEEKLKIAGIMLYWSEGTLRNNTVDFANSNPDMIKLFLKFLREICGVSEERLRVYLYAYEYQNLKRIKDYWARITNIQLNQFTKPYIRKGNPNSSNRKLPYGLVHIRYNDKKLLGLIKVWIDEFKNSSLMWAGTQVAKGDRLCKSSVLSKGRMEK